MGIQKNFVVKNGIEVNDNLIFADKDQNTVGIGTTITPEKLQVNGGIGATSIVLTGVGTIPTLKSTNALVSNGYINVGVVTSITGTGLTYTTGNLGTLNATTGNIVTGVVTTVSGTDLTYTNGSITTLNSGTVLTPSLYAVSGVVTSITGTGLTYTNGTITTLNSNEVLTSNLYAVSGVVTSITGTGLTYTNATITNLTGTAATIGTVQISAGIITSSSGIVTYYGDGTYLDLAANSGMGIGIGTVGGVVGYGATFLDFQGSGISTVTVSAGIATINITGGGGGGGDVQFDSLVVVNHTDLNTLDVSGISTFNNLAGAVKIGVGTTALLVEGDARITGILTIGTSSITLDGSNNQITIGGGLTINSSSISVDTFSGSDINVSGIVTASSFNGSGESLTTLNASNISSGTLGNDRLPQDISVSGIVTANTFSGSGESLTTLNASNISSGTLGNDRLPQDISVSGIVTANTFSGSGSSLTTLNASNISSGTVPTARLASGTADNTTYLRGDQTWATVTSGITITNDTSTNATRYLTFTSATSGSISAENVSSTKLTFNPSTGTLTVTDVNSTSDINLKENIHTVENPLETISSLRGVSFDWKETGKSSYGVIAQELEEVLPELVGTGEVKSVNYNGLVGVLIEAIKELKKEIEDLKSSK